MDDRGGGDIAAEPLRVPTGRRIRVRAQRMLPTVKGSTLSQHQRPAREPGLASEHEEMVIVTMSEVAK
jgi:hypothetical protein